MALILSKHLMKPPRLLHVGCGPLGRACSTTALASAAAGPSAAAAAAAAATGASLAASAAAGPCAACPVTDITPVACFSHMEPMVRATCNAPGLIGGCALACSGEHYSLLAWLHDAPQASAARRNCGHGWQDGWRQLRLLRHRCTGSGWWSVGQYNLQLRLTTVRCEPPGFQHPERGWGWGGGRQALEGGPGAGWQG